MGHPFLFEDDEIRVGFIRHAPIEDVSKIRKGVLPGPGRDSADGNGLHLEELARGTEDFVDFKNAWHRYLECH
jgi:hypothetical protein